MSRKWFAPDLSLPAKRRFAPGAHRDGVACERIDKKAAMIKMAH
jgi:hypothetical protein